MRPLAIFLNVMGFLSALYLPTVTALLTFKILTVDTLGWSKWVLLPTAIIFLVVTASKEWVPRLKPSRNIIMIATRAFLDNNRLLLLEKIKQINGGKEVECRTNIAVIKRKKLFWKVIKTKYYDSNYKEDDADYDITFRINEGLVGLVAYRTTVIQEAGKKPIKLEGLQQYADLDLPDKQLMSEYNLTEELVGKTRHLKSLLCTPIRDGKKRLVGFYSVDSKEPLATTCFDKEEVRTFAIEITKNIYSNLGRLVI